MPLNLLILVPEKSTVVPLNVAFSCGWWVVVLVILAAFLLLYKSVSMGKRALKKLSRKQKLGENCQRGVIESQLAGLI